MRTSNICSLLPNLTFKLTYSFSFSEDNAIVLSDANALCIAKMSEKHIGYHNAQYNRKEYLKMTYTNGDFSFD